MSHGSIVLLPSFLPLFVVIDGNIGGLFYDCPYAPRVPRFALGLFCSFFIEQTFVFLWCGFSPFPLGNKRSKMRPKEEKGGFGRRES